MRAIGRWLIIGLSYLVGGAGLAAPAVQVSPKPVAFVVRGEGWLSAQDLSRLGIDVRSVGKGVRLEINWSGWPKRSLEFQPDSGWRDATNASLSGIPAPRVIYGGTSVSGPAVFNVSSRPAISTTAVPMNPSAAVNSSVSVSTSISVSPEAVRRLGFLMSAAGRGSQTVSDQAAGNQAVENAAGNQTVEVSPPNRVIAVRRGESRDLLAGTKTLRFVLDLERDLLGDLALESEPNRWRLCLPGMLVQPQLIVGNETLVRARLSADADLPGDASFELELRVSPSVRAFRLSNPPRIVVDVLSRDPGRPRAPGPVPDGVSWRRVSVVGSTLHLVTIDSNRFSLRLASAPYGGALDVDEFAKRAGAVVAVNGGYFDPASNLPVDLAVMGQMPAAFARGNRATIGLFGNALLSTGVSITTTTPLTNLATSTTTIPPSGLARDGVNQIGASDGMAANNVSDGINTTNSAGGVSSTNSRAAVQALPVAATNPQTPLFSLPGASPRLQLTVCFGESAQIVKVNAIRPDPRPDWVTAFVGDGFVPVGAPGIKSIVVRDGRVLERRESVFVARVGDLVLSASGSRLQELEQAIGTSVLLTLEWSDLAWRAVEMALAAGPRLVMNGAVVLDGLLEGFDVNGSIWRPTRQAGFGVDARGNSVIALLEYGSPEAFAVALAANGVTEAMRLDSGTSASLVLAEGFVGGIRGRSVPNALVVVPRQQVTR